MSSNPSQLKNAARILRVESKIALAAALALGVISGSANAINVTGVSAPDLLRPIDSLLYAFGVTVSGTYDAADILAGVARPITVDYWDDDLIFDDAIDTTGAIAIMPAPGAAAAGIAWLAPATLWVGCRPRIFLGPEVFGPSGGTGENPMNDGFFHLHSGAGLFAANHGSWGYNTVTCSGAPGATTSRPMGLVDAGRNCPVPGNPGVPCRVPEPWTALLVGTALLACALARKSGG